MSFPKLKKAHLVIFLPGIFMLVILIAIVAISFYNASQKYEEQSQQVPVESTKSIEEITVEEMDTSDWQTYRNEEFGFEVKYPDSFAYEGTPPGDSMLLAIGPKSKYQAESTIVMSVHFIVKPDQTQLKEFAQDVIKDSAFTLFSQGDLIIGNKMGYEIVFKGPISTDPYRGAGLSTSPESSVRAILFEEDMYFFEIIVPQSSAVYNKILSTFRFIESIDTSDWQTDRNEKFGFEVKYPEDVFAVVPIEGNFVGYGESTNQGSKLMFANRKENLGSEECAYGETNFKSICRAESEDGIAFVFLPKRFADFQTQYTGYDAYREEIIGGRKGFSWGIDFEFTYRSVHYYIELEDEKTLYIQIMATGTLTYKEDEFGRYIYLPSEEMVDQILSTFRFIE